MFQGRCNTVGRIKNFAPIASVSLRPPSFLLGTAAFLIPPRSLSWPLFSAILQLLLVHNRGRTNAVASSLSLSVCLSARVPVPLAPPPAAPSVSSLAYERNRTHVTHSLSPLRSPTKAPSFLEVPLRSHHHVEQLPSLTEHRPKFPPSSTDQAHFKAVLLRVPRFLDPHPAPPRLGLALSLSRRGGRIGERHFLSDFIRSSGPPLSLPISLSSPLLGSSASSSPTRTRVDGSAFHVVAESPTFSGLDSFQSKSLVGTWEGGRERGANLAWPPGRRPAARAGGEGRSSWYEPTILSLSLSTICQVAHQLFFRRREREGGGGIG